LNEAPTPDAGCNDEVDAGTTCVAGATLGLVLALGGGIFGRMACRLPPPPPPPPLPHPC